MRAGLFLALLCWAPLAGAAPPPDLVPKYQAASDIRFALDRAEAVHPDLYWNSEREKVEARAEELVDALPDPTPRHEVYLALSRIFALLGDGHVTVWRPYGSLTSDTRLLPVRAEPVGDGLRVTGLGAAVPGLAVGDVITRIGDAPALDWWDRAVAITSGEPAWQRVEVGEDFGTALWDLGARAPFQVVVRTAEMAVGDAFGGESDERVVEVAGTPRKSIRAVRDGEIATEGLGYALLPERIGVLRLRHQQASEDRYRERLADLFARMDEEQVVGVILDLRHDNGGDSNRGQDILEYLTDAPRRPFARKTIRVSRECREQFDDEDDSIYAGTMRELADGERKTWEVPRRTTMRKPEGRGVPFAVLIGPGTFSAGTTLANEIADAGLAPVFGAPSAQSANNYGEPCRVTLPHTRITFRVAAGAFVRANGDAGTHEPVLPTVPVAATGPEEEAGPTMQAAAEWLLRAAHRGD